MTAVYEFFRSVFGGYYCPFYEQYTWQKQLQLNKNMIDDVFDVMSEYETQ